jgi:DNA repair protein RadC
MDTPLAAPPTPSAATIRQRRSRWPQDCAQLADAEVLALLLGAPCNRKALERARALLGEFGGLRALLATDPRRKAPARALGARSVMRLQAALELARRHYGAALRCGPLLGSLADTRRFLTAQLRDRPYEVFCCLYLDNRHRLIAFEELFRGTIDGASVHPREVVREALAHNAAALILAHNHPSGVAEPSR